MPGAVGPDAAWLAARRDRRRMGRRSRAPDAAFAPVRRLRRIRQARVADVLGPSGPQSLQRAGVVRQSSGQPASVSRAIVVVAEGQIVCEHRRVFARSHERKSTTTVYDWRHYLAVIQRKPGALRNGAPFVELPPAFRALQQRMLKTPGGDREMVEILALVLQHDEQAVLATVELAPEAGAPTKTHILNLLHRLVDGKPTDTPTIKAPQALTLKSAICVCMWSMTEVARSTSPRGHNATAR